MSKISNRVSEIFGFRIEEGKWKNYLEEIDREGEPTRKHIAEILFILAEEMEDIERNLESLNDKTAYVTRTEKGRDTNKSL